MKHEVLTRAIDELDDELIADAYAYKPRKRYALPRFLAAAACLALVLAAALAMTRDTLPAEIKVEGAALAQEPAAFHVQVNLFSCHFLVPVSIPFPSYFFLLASTAGPAERR